MEFLVERVWKIHTPVRVVDFGCGIGFLGALLLPILPIGSTYTGINKGARLIGEAKSLFADSGYNTTFIEADLIDLVPEEKYDMAICQCVRALIHRGLSEQEAVCVVECELQISNYMETNGDQTYVVEATCMLISYGLRRLL